LLIRSAAWRLSRIATVRRLKLTILQAEPFGAAVAKMIEQTVTTSGSLKLCSWGLKDSSTEAEDIVEREPTSLDALRDPE
jgi:hypothetical protein